MLWNEIGTPIPPPPSSAKVVPQPIAHTSPRIQPEYPGERGNLIPISGPRSSPNPITMEARSDRSEMGTDRFLFWVDDNTCINKMSIWSQRIDSMWKHLMFLNCPGLHINSLKCLLLISAVLGAHFWLIVESWKCYDKAKVVFLSYSVGMHSPPPHTHRQPVPVQFQYFLPTYPSSSYPLTHTYTPITSSVSTIRQYPGEYLNIHILYVFLGTTTKNIYWIDSGNMLPNTQRVRLWWWKRKLWHIFYITIMHTHPHTQGWLCCRKTDTC
jgi:hypothetical protein